MSQRMHVFKTNDGYLIAGTLLDVVEHLVAQSGRPPHPNGLWGQKTLSIEDLGEVKILAQE